MSQSDMHRRMVVNAATAIRQQHPKMRLTLDIQDAPGDPVPSSVNGHRPDIAGLSTGACFRVLIAEAKTDGDIDNSHTRRQVDAYLRHLDTIKSGTGIFIMAVNGEAADIARGLLKFHCRARVSSCLQVKVFDGLDFWTLGPQGGEPWHLS